MLQRPQRSPHYHAPLLVPHLLLHDDGLVQLDARDYRQTRLRVAEGEGRTGYQGIARANPALERAFVVEDSARLLPLQIQAMQPRQFWITAFVPPGAAAGQYRGQVIVAPANAPSQTVPVTLDVLPFRLPPPGLEYSVIGRAGRGVGSL